jgi:hypothetical protein
MSKRHFSARRYMRRGHSSFVDSSVDVSFSSHAIDFAKFCVVCGVRLNGENRSVDSINVCRGCSYRLES